MNIQEALNKLNDFGLSDKQIGVQVSATTSIICRLRNGVHKTASYERGKKIFDLLDSVSEKKDKQ